MGPFHKSSYKRFLLYEFVEPVLNYRSNEFVALTNLCETGLCTVVHTRGYDTLGKPIERNKVEPHIQG